MLLCFVDESNSKTFYGFAGLIADEYATKAITTRLNRLMQQAHTEYGVPEAAEIHSHPMFQGKGDWRDVSSRARAHVHERVVDTIIDTDATIVLRSVDPAAFHEGKAPSYDLSGSTPEQECFKHILQRVDQVARLQRTHALVIADERSDRDRHRQRFALYQAEGTPGAHMRTHLDSLLDTLHFAPSHYSRMLQAADVLAFTWRRYQTVRETDGRAHRVMERIWEKLESSGKLFDAGGWP